MITVTLENGKSIQVSKEFLEKVLHSWCMSDEYMECSSEDEKQTDLVESLLE